MSASSTDSVTVASPDARNTPAVSLSPTAASSEKSYQGEQGYNHVRFGEHTSPGSEKASETIDEDEWSYKKWLQNYEKDIAAKNLQKHLALTWDALEIIGVDSKAVLADDVLSYINPMEYIRNARGKSTTVNKSAYILEVNLLTRIEYHPQNVWTSPTWRNGLLYPAIEICMKTPC